MAMLGSRAGSPPSWLQWRERRRHSSSRSTMSLSSTGGFAGTVNLTAASVPSGITTSCVPSTLTGNGTSTCTLTANKTGTYTVTITGTSGTLVHSATIDVLVLEPDFSL